MTNEELINLIKEGENYQANYDLLVSLSKSRGLNKSSLDYYTECHHILPKCMGGKDEDENYVLFTYPEHIIAHILLSKLYPEEKSLIFATTIMIYPGCRDKKHIDNFQFNESLKLINSLDFDFLSKLKKKNQTERGKSVVCIDPITGKAVKLYRTLKEIIEDGFRSYISYKLFTETNENNPIVHYNGYDWCYEEFFNGVISENNNKIIPIPENLIICHNNDKIYYTFDNIKKFVRENDKITKTLLCLAIKTNKKYGLFNWTRAENFIKKYKISPIDIINFKNPDHPIFFTNFIISCRDITTKQIIKIYGSSKDLEKDGFSYEAIRAAACRKHLSYGYYWDREVSSEELNEYYNRCSYIIPSPGNKKVAIGGRVTYIQLDKETFDVIQIFFPETRDKELLNRNYKLSNIRSSVKREGISYNSRWMKYEDYANKYPDKLKGYESRN